MSESPEPICGIDGCERGPMHRISHAGPGDDLPESPETTPLSAAARAVVDAAEPDWGDEGWIDYLVPHAAIDALRAALDAARATVPAGPSHLSDTADHPWTKVARPAPAAIEAGAFDHANDESVPVPRRVWVEGVTVEGRQTPGYWRDPTPSDEAVPAADEDRNTILADGRPAYLDSPAADEDRERLDPERIARAAYKVLSPGRTGGLPNRATLLLDGERIVREYRARVSPSTGDDRLDVDRLTQAVERSSWQVHSTAGSLATAIAREYAALSAGAPDTEDYVPCHGWKNQRGGVCTHPDHPDTEEPR